MKDKLSRVLLLDTNFSSAPIRNYLIDSGYDVFVMGRDEKDFLAKHSKNYIKGDYSSYKELVSVVNKFDIKYVIPGCNDLSYESAARLKMATRNVDNYDNFQKVFNKREFRLFAQTQGLSVPRVFNQSEALEWIKEHPLIVKPVDSFSGKGVTKIDNNEAHRIEGSILNAINASRNGNYIIEEFVQGQLYSHSSFIKNGTIINDFFVKEFGTVNPFVVDTSFVSNDLSSSIQLRVQQEVEKIASVLNLKDGLVHSQFIFRDDKIWLIELTRRCPGDLYSKLIESSTGFNYTEMYVKPFIGEDIEAELLERKTLPVIRHTITNPKIGIFDSVNFHISLDNLSFHLLTISGDKIHPSPLGRVGVFFVNAKSCVERGHLVDRLIDRTAYDVCFWKN